MKRSFLDRLHERKTLLPDATADQWSRFLATVDNIGKKVRGLNKKSWIYRQLRVLYPEDNNAILETTAILWIRSAIALMALTAAGIILRKRQPSSFAGFNHERQLLAAN